MVSLKFWFIFLALDSICSAYLVFFNFGFEHYLRGKNCMAAWRDLEYHKKGLGLCKKGSVSL